MLVFAQWQSGSYSKLRSIILYGRGYSFKIRSLDSISFPGMCYCIDFVDTVPTVYNFIGES